MIQSDVSSEIYNGNNSTTIPYPIPFYFFRDEDLLVTSIDSLGSEQPLQLNTDYIVTGAGNQNGGSLKTTFEVPLNWKLLIERIVEPTQLTSYQEGDSFPAKSHERALDKLTMLVQQALRGSGGSSGGGGGRAWADDAERALTTPNFTGQLGFQVNTATIYYAESMTTGDWKTAVFDNTSAAMGQVAVFSAHSHLTTQTLDGIATLVGGVLGAMAKPAGELVGTTEPQTLTNKTLESPVINTPTGLRPVDVGLGNVDNISDANKPISNATAVALAEKEDKINKGQNGGYAGLDATGKVPLQQMPESVLGANVYQGTWNAATNTPTIPAAALANQGWYWVVSVAGSTNIDGTSTWAPGDWIISNGSIWQRIANIDSVSSVNSKTGAVVITKADVGLSNVDNTSDATKNSAVVTLTNKTLAAPVINSPTGLTKADVGLSAVDNTSDAQKNVAVATLTNKTIDGASNTLNVRLASDVSGNLPVARLNGGASAGSTTFWRGDGQWVSLPGGGDVTGPAGAVAGELATYANSTGKLLGRTTLPAAEANMVIGDTAQGSHPANAIIVPAYVSHPDRIISNPTAFDDHFDGTSLNAKWVMMGTGGYSYSVNGSCLNAQAVSSAPGDGIGYYVDFAQSLPNADSFIINLKVESLLTAHAVAGSISKLGVSVYSTAPSKQGLYMVFATAFVSGVGAQTSVDFYRGLNLATLHSAHFYGDYAKYIQIIWNRSTYNVDIYSSVNGIAWFPFAPGFSSALTGLSASILPSKFAITTTAVNNARSAMSCDWITFVNN